MGTASVYLIPVSLDPEILVTIPAYVLDALKSCSVFFVEDERTARRFLKKFWKEIIIDNYGWQNIKEVNPAVKQAFLKALKEGKTIGIMSEAGCPGVADPGQELVKLAHDAGIQVKPLVGPNAMLLALMASGMNGQQYRFSGYLPIDIQERQKAIRELETESARLKCTQIFMETPYRNNQLIEVILKTCKPETLLCLAADITGEHEFIKTMPVKSWKHHLPDLHKRPAVFLLYAQPG